MGERGGDARAGAARHDSAAKHVAGRAIYIDDMPEPHGLLHLALGLSQRAHAKILDMDLSAVRAAPGVVAVFTARDIPGRNDVGPVVHDDPIFADGLVQYAGQSLFAVAAETVELARTAARKAVVHYDDLPAVLDIDTARAAGLELEKPQRMVLGDGAAALARAPHRAAGRLTIGGQDHFYLEGQVALALPQEDRDILIYSSTQHPSELQHLVADMLGVASNAVTVEVRRMGGAFGGKETQAALPAAVAALAAAKTGRPAKFCLDRDDDMVLTGKRHDFQIAYDVGFGDDGRIEGIEFVQESRCGYSTDLSLAINDRAMFHADNSYFLGNATIVSHRYKTHTVSNTAFRGFGGPQGMMGIERVMDVIAQRLGKDPLDVRKINLYGPAPRNLTPYHQAVDDNIAPDIIAALEEKSHYRARRRAVAAFNAENEILKRGLALTPVKFGISFTTTHLNQAGALVHVYADGSVHLNHGGTEMGQGLMTKVAQVVAEEFHIDVEQVKITATTTGKVPNTSATAASAGADLNGMAAQAAARTIKERLIAFAAAAFKCAPEAVIFRDNHVVAGTHRMRFAELVRAAHIGRVSLSSTGFYKTPKIHYDRSRHRGRPFFYFAYGAAVSEVAIDTLTGENRVLRVDILHDVGRSLNPGIDFGQIEGGFMQGMGWLTTEELVFDGKGHLKTHAPSTYKIPACSDRPPVFNMELWPAPNREDTVHRSKAVGEPPLMLAISVFAALTDAVASVADHREMPELDAPATPERILRAVEKLRA
ncbi:MAG TPA: xanthine dehydrogenase molybdopterin binding subunit [Rhizomicrobium sp.]|jgi:xanthine dehydrogenase large subunit|nr:xanthine dehydrogenase molybdopterin binding subunit [Rhizomicrobium sp.]